MKQVEEDNYPEPVIVNPGDSTSLLRVLLLALLFIIIAVVITIYGERFFDNIVLMILGFLAVFGVFCLFALAAGLFKFAFAEQKRTLAKTIVDSLPYGAVVSERDGKIIYSNAKYLEFVKRINNGLPVSVPRLFANVSGASEAIYRISLAAREGRPASEDIRVNRQIGELDLGADSAIFWYRLSVRALPRINNSNKPLILWSLQDISNDKKQQENIFSQLQSAIDYLDHAPAGFFSSNEHGEIQYINSTLIQWLGYSLAEFEAGMLTMSEIVRGDGASLLRGGSSDGEIRTEIIDIDLVKRDGTNLPVRLLHRAARLAEGRLGETRTLVLDRSSGSDLEEDLRAIEVRFSRFFNDTPFAIATLDASGRIVRTNAPFIRIFGLNAEERSVEHRSIVNLIAQEGREAFSNGVALALEKRSDIEPIDALLESNEDSAIKIYITSSEKMHDSDERVIIYALDMTEQRKLEAQFAQGQKMQAVGQLAGGVAHDFNNVLTAIIGFSDLLLLKHKSTDPSFGDIMSIKQSANRAAGLVRQLLAFSRRQTLRPQILEIQTNIDELLVLLKRLIGDKVTLDVSHENSDWVVRVDLVQLEQVIINLVVNARDAMPDGGHIEIRTSNVDEEEAEKLNYRGMPTGEYVLIEVEDSGTGMSEEVVEKIFEPFFSTKKLNEGTGLGLSTVYGIIKQTGGFIYPDSILGEGTTFKIFLPRHIVQIGDIEEEEKVAAPIKDLTGNERILIVEDEEAVRAFSARALSATGYEVLEADGGEEALEILEEIDYELDLLISDVIMPEMDGPTLLKKVRERTKDLKVILVSGYAEESIRKDLEDDRSFEFLAKPYSLDQINSKVKEVLQRED